MWTLADYERWCLYAVSFPFSPWGNGCLYSTWVTHLGLLLPKTVSGATAVSSHALLCHAVWHRASVSACDISPTWCELVVLPHTSPCWGCHPAVMSSPIAHVHGLIAEDLFDWIKELEFGKPYEWKLFPTHLFLSTLKVYRDKFYECLLKWLQKV